MRCSTRRCARRVRCASCATPWSRVGFRLQEAKELADAVDDRALCDQPETPPRSPVRSPVSGPRRRWRRRPSWIQTGRVIHGPGKALADLEAVKEALDDGTSQFPFEARIIPTGRTSSRGAGSTGIAYLRETVSALVAPGGTGKSIIAVVEALSIATGRRHLLHDEAIGRGGSCTGIWKRGSGRSSGASRRRRSSSTSRPRPMRDACSSRAGWSTRSRSRPPTATASRSTRPASPR